MEPTKYTQAEIQVWEEQIIEKINRKQTELFANESVKLHSSDELTTQIQEYVLDLLKDFPRDENSNIFIGSIYTVTPLIVVKYSDLRPIIEAENADSLFASEVGKMITITSLVSDVYGAFITAPTRIELRNIEFPENFDLKPNEWTKEKAQAELSAAVCINSERTLGTINIDSTLRTGEAKATVDCGGKVLENHKITFKMHADNDAEVSIPLPHLAMSAKINYDGMITFPNGKTFSLAETLPPGQRVQKYICINSPWQMNLNFHIDSAAT